MVVGGGAYSSLIKSPLGKKNNKIKAFSVENHVESVGNPVDEFLTSLLPHSAVFPLPGHRGGKFSTIPQSLVFSCFYNHELPK
mgnify:CR=1 FL=1